MPKIDKIFSLEITPERFLEACSLNELQEVSLLLDAAIIRKQHEVNNRNADSETHEGFGKRWDNYASEQLRIEKKGTTNIG